MFLGLRWQSLIVSPNRQSWMTPPSIEDRQHYKMVGERLRTVPSCWLGAAKAKAAAFCTTTGRVKLHRQSHASLKGNHLHLKSSRPCALSGLALEGWEHENP